MESRARPSMSARRKSHTGGSGNGIVLIVVAALVTAGVLLFLLMRYRNRDRADRESLGLANTANKTLSTALSQAKAKEVQDASFIKADEAALAAAQAAANKETSSLTALKASLMASSPCAVRVTAAGAAVSKLIQLLQTLRPQYASTRIATVKEFQAAMPLGLNLKSCTAMLEGDHKATTAVVRYTASDGVSVENCSDMYAAGVLLMMFGEPSTIVSDIKKLGFSGVTAFAIPPPAPSMLLGYDRGVQFVSMSSAPFAAPKGYLGATAAYSADGSGPLSVGNYGRGGVMQWAAGATAFSAVFKMSQACIPVGISTQVVSSGTPSGADVVITAAGGSSATGPFPVALGTTTFLGKWTTSYPITFAPQGSKTVQYVQLTFTYKDPPTTGTAPSPIVKSLAFMALANWKA